MGVLSVYIVSIFLYLRTDGVPPEACFANFRWEDCGEPPVPVMYYWKPGSRCEVGLWRGCHPSLNMFHDEYECTATCIMSNRARPQDYHSMNEEIGPQNTTDDANTETVTETEIPELENSTMSADNTTAQNTTAKGDNTTSTAEDNNATTTEISNTTAPENETTKSD